MKSRIGFRSHFEWCSLIQVKEEIEGTNMIRKKDMGRMMFKFNINRLEPMRI